MRFQSCKALFETPCICALVTAVKAHRVSRGIAPLILSPRYYMHVNRYLLAPVTLLAGKNFGAH